MKKLISIGVVLALLTLVVVPAAVAAETVMPSTYAKIPFAIVESGFVMLGCLLGQLDPILAAAGMELPIDLADLAPVVNTLGNWAGGPLAWSVDMLGWGLGIVECVIGFLATPLGLPTWITDVVGCISDALVECYPAATVCNNVSNAYTCP